MIDFATDDGTELTGDLALPNTPRAAAIVCHPHPQFGGNRFNHVVQALFETLPTGGVATLRFDFRREYGAGVAEVADARAAVDALVAAAPGVPVLAVGYSFGAVVTLHLSDDRLAGKVLVAPPLGISGDAPEPGTPTLVMTPAGDQFCPPEVAEPTVSSWTDAELHVIDAADHFLNGRSPAVAIDALVWIDQLLARGT